MTEQPETTQQTPDQDVVELDTPGTNITDPVDQEEANRVKTSPDVEIVEGEAEAAESDEEQGDEETDD
jgi:hypothetical protein